MHELTQDDLQRLLAGGPRKVHLVGVAGSGMSGLARLLALRGHRVTGSDLGEDTDAEALRQLGIQRFRGHAPEHVGNPDFVAYSSAIPNDNDELLEAQSRGIPVVRRARALAALVPPQQAIVVAGTHGKTTTSAMIAHILRVTGQAPSFFVGGQVPDLGGNASLGNGRWFVLEADESDGTMSEFRPHELVILNIEAEHLDFYRDLDAIESAFESLARSATGRVVYCLDDAGATRVGERSPGGVGYSACGSKAAHRKGAAHPAWRAGEIRPDAAQTVFRVWQAKDCLGEVRLAIPGLQNVANAVAALAVTVGLGVSFDAAASALAAYHGARRRFDRLFESEEFLLVDDYAHHPTEVRATIGACRQKGRSRIVAVFQPHRYTRTKALHKDFGRAFDEADRVFLTDIYAASETPMEGVDGQLVADAVVAKRGADGVTYEPDLWRLMERVGGDLRKGDLLVVMGAGNIVQVGRTLARELCVYEAIRKAVKPGTVLRRYESMAQRTSLRVGGPAKLWVEPLDVEDLTRILRHCDERRQALGGDHPEARFHAVTCIGRGSNLLVRDAGLSGVTLHLSAPAFTGIEVDGERLVAGAGVRLKQIAATAKQAGLGGLEFLDGIPGCLGGGLWTNAGAMGGALFDVVERVRLADFAGHLVEKEPAELGVGYRTCAGLWGHIVLSAVLKGRPADRAKIEANLREFEKRRWASQPTEASAGCVFKNPPGQSAGKLIEDLGMKNLRFGGARVSEIHANFIVNDGGATAADVLNLISMVRDRVRRGRGIELELEVEVLGDERR